MRPLDKLISLIGKNQLTIPIAQNLSSQLYQVSLYYRNDLSDKRKLSDAISMIEISITKKSC